MCSQDTRVSMPNSISKEFLRFSRTRRREIISQTKKGCAPLFLACKNGHLNLLLAGADVNATNNRGCSPLMYSIFRVVETKSEKYQKIIKILLEARAHIDQVMFGKTISEHVGFRKFLDITGTKVHINLQCLAARAIRRYHIPYAAGRVSSALEIFIGLH